jgi:hypothetical protein
MFAALLDKLTLGTPATHGGLTLTPILLEGEALSPIEPLALEQALADGVLQVSEVSLSGSVPELRVKSTSDLPVLILDGEELVGAKQNRIVNVSILVPPHAEVVIPVSCIEAGRWGYSRRSFEAAERVLSHEIRMAKSASVTRSLKTRGAHASDQGEVWAGVDKALSALRTDSGTRALSDGYESRGEAIQDYLKALGAQPRQVGVIYRIHGALAGLDLLGSERSFARAYPKLLRGSALQAIAGYDNTSRSRLDEELLLRRALEAPAERFPAVGLGEDVRIDTPDVGGGALHLNPGLVHLFVFARRAPQGSLEAA